MILFNKNLDEYQSLLFDLDGTLVNSMPYHNEAWIKALADHGANIDISLLHETAGMSSLRIVEIVNQRLGLNLDPKDVSRVKRDIYLKNVHLVEVVTPLLDIVQKYHEKLPLGIITGGSHEVVDQLLPKLKLDHFFDAVICSDDTVKGKDSTEPYELAGKLLNVDPTKCLFFDDGDVGLKGATLTGMDIVHVDINNPKIFIA